MKDPRNYLPDMLTELADVADFTAAGQQAFMANRMAQKAVIRSYESHWRNCQAASTHPPRR